MKHLKILTKTEGDVAHCQLDNLHRVHYYIFDWLAETLGATEPLPGPRLAAR